MSNSKLEKAQKEDKMNEDKIVTITNDPNERDIIRSNVGHKSIMDGIMVDVRLTDKAIDCLWDIINGTSTDARSNLAGNISNSRYIEDKNNIFYENVLKHWSEYMFFKNWNNYYDVHIAKYIPLPEFSLQKLWVNYQKQHEFNPPHGHGGLFTFVIFMKIPTHWKEQHALSNTANSGAPVASNFEFLIGQGQEVRCHPIPLSPEDEGRMLFFPANLTHQVFPFYGTEEERITISGNIIGLIDGKEDETDLDKKEKMLETMKRNVNALEKTIEKERNERGGGER